MFIFPWLDWGMDISVFEKIDFFARDPFFVIFCRLKRHIFPFWRSRIFYVPRKFYFLKVPCLGFQITCRTFLYDFKRKKTRLVYGKKAKKTLWVGFWLARLEIYMRLQTFGNPLHVLTKNILKRVISCRKKCALCVSWSSWLPSRIFHKKSNKKMSKFL